MKIVVGVVVLMLHLPSVQAWDYPVHRLVNELALISLPTNFPAFVQSPDKVERILFLSGEPDRWRNTSDRSLKHVNGPDHYIDIEDLKHYGISPTNLPPLRYDFVAMLAVERAANPDPWAHLTEENNRDHTKELCGLLPWTISEYYSQLKSGFSYLKAFEQSGGSAAEISNAQQDIVYMMGVMGHFVGDAAQPLHTTKHYNGWVGENPHGYTTNHGFHSWIDGGFWREIGVPTARQLQAQLHKSQGVATEAGIVTAEDMFPAIVEFVQQQHELVEPLYHLEQDGGLNADGEKVEEGREFLQTQVIVGAQMLGDLWVSAWLQAPEDNYLKRQLSERQKESSPANP